MTAAMRTVLTTTVGALAAFAVSHSVAEAQVRTEPPERWGVPPPLVRATLEVEEQRLPDRVTFAYRVRNLSDPTDETYPAVVKLVVGGPVAVGTSLLGSVVTVEAPAGWEVQVLPGEATGSSAWQVSWTCADKGWEHTLEHRVMPGSTLGGFRVSVLIPNAEYSAAPYEVSLVPNSGRLSASHRLQGMPFRVKPRQP